MEMWEIMSIEELNYCYFRNGMYLEVSSGRVVMVDYEGAPNIGMRMLYKKIEGEIVQYLGCGSYGITQ